MPLCTVGGCASSRFYPYQLCSHHHDLIQRPVQYAKNSSGAKSFDNKRMQTSQLEMLVQEGALLLSPVTEHLRL